MAGLICPPTSTDVHLRGVVDGCSFYVIRRFVTARKRHVVLQRGTLCCMVCGVVCCVWCAAWCGVVCGVVWVMAGRICPPTSTDVHFKSGLRNMTPFGGMHVVLHGVVCGVAWVMACRICLSATDKGTWMYPAAAEGVGRWAYPQWWTWCLGDCLGDSGCIPLHS